MNLLLASNSPRRKELLTQLGYQFDIVMIDVDESYPSDLKPHEIAEYVSAKKAKAFDVNENEILLTSDTIVALDQKILLKPKDVTVLHIPYLFDLPMFLFFISSCIFELLSGLFFPLPREHLLVFPLV